MKSFDEFIFESTTTLSVKKLNLVYHVGSLDISKKSESSLEGSGLSVSLHPDEWVKINKMGGSDLFILTKENGLFVNCYKLNKLQKQSIIMWGVDSGYVIQDKTYRVCWYDEEMEGEVYMEFPTYDEAKGEVDDDDGRKIKIHNKGLKPTKKLEMVTMQSKISTTQTFDLLLTVYVENETDYDGIWWNDELDVSKYSAPRGVIFNSKLKEWSVKGDPHVV